MKILTLQSALAFSLLVSSVIAVSGATPDGVSTLKIGDTAPDFDLVGVDGKSRSLKDFAKADVIMIAFISNHCPDSQGTEKRLIAFLDDMKGKSFALVAINPNDPAALRPDELGYSKYNDSFEEMKLHAKEQGFNFPYLNDGQTQTTAKAYGCLATPHVFVFDKDRKLQYKGRFDDSRFADPATVTASEGPNAVKALLAGEPVSVQETKVHGCSTKWTAKKDAVAADQQKWEKGEVQVELIDAKGVAALRKNDTPKVRLFNVWATWCISCVEEFPELVKTSRKFGLRDFEFISISMDDPATLPDVKKFLEDNNAIVPDKLQPSLAKEGRKGNAYVFSDSNSDALIQALDPEWEGPVPHTLVVGPGGEVIYRHNGEIDGEELRAKILEAMGRFYKPEPETK